MVLTAALYRDEIIWVRSTLLLFSYAILLLLLRALSYTLYPFRCLLIGFLYTYAGLHFHLSPA